MAARHRLKQPATKFQFLQEVNKRHICLFTRIVIVHRGPMSSFFDLIEKIKNIACNLKPCIEVYSI